MSLTTENITYKPFSYNWAMEITAEHEKVHWIPEELSLTEDVAQWNSKLSKKEKNHITNILKLFTTSDVVVAGCYANHFIPVFKNNEIRSMLISFAARESIHQRAYALLNDTLGLPEEYYNAFSEYDQLKNKVDFMQDMSTDTQRSTALAIAREVISEGVSLFSLLAQLLSYTRTGKMMGMGSAVEWSIRDESIHARGLSQLFVEYCKEHKRIVNDDFKKAIYDSFREAITLEDEVIDLSFEMGALSDLTPEDMKQYIRYIADIRLVDLGMKPNWNIESNPIPWIEYLLGNSHTNFFEQRVTDYNAAGMDGDWGWDDSA